MRDLLSKLDALVSETALQNKDDLAAKQKALHDIQMDPNTAKDPELKAELARRKASLEKEAKDKGFTEEFEIGDAFGISFSEDFEIATEIVGFLDDGIVIELDEHALGLLESNNARFLEGELVEGVAGPQSCWKGYRKVGTKPGTGKNAGKRVNDCEKIGEDHKVDPEDPENRAEYDNEGDMAKDDLRTINSAAQELYDIIQSEENLPEWVQAKITKAVDYIDTVRDYLKANKEIDEAKYHGKEVPLGKKLPGDVKKSKVYVRKPNGKIVKVNFGDKKMRIKKSNPARRRSFRARHNCKNPGPRWKARYWSCRSW